MYLYILNIKFNSRSNIQVIHIEGISFLPLITVGFVIRIGGRFSDKYALGTWGFLIDDL